MMIVMVTAIVMEIVIGDDYDGNKNSNGNSNR